MEAETRFLESRSLNDREKETDLTMSYIPIIVFNEKTILLGNCKYNMYIFMGSSYPGDSDITLEN